MSLVLVACGDGLVARPPDLRETLAARLRAGRLDRQLARGVCPEATAALSLRAQAIVRRQHQRQLAALVAWAIAQSRAPATRPTSAAVPVRRRSVIAAEGSFLRLLNRLQGPGPLPVAGVARVRLLFVDGAGPLYYAGCPTSLRAAVDEALEALG